MVGGSAQDLKPIDYLRGLGIHCWIRGVAQNPGTSIYRDRAGRPPVFSVMGEPAVRLFMIVVGRIEKRDKHVYVKESYAQASSLSSFTIRRSAFERPFGVNSGTPLRTCNGVLTIRDSRARREMTWPRVAPCSWAKRFAAVRRSSSRSKVVRIHPDYHITHHLW